MNIVQKIKNMKPFERIDITNHPYRLQMIEITKDAIDKGYQYGFSDDFNTIKYLPVPEITGKP